MWLLDEDFSRGHPMMMASSRVFYSRLITFLITFLVPFLFSVKSSASSDARCAGTSHC